MKRRDFMRTMAAMPLLSRNYLTGSALLTSMTNVYAASGKTLIVIFQRGGCDGLNTVVPHGEDEYYKLRPDIAIATPGTGSGSALDLDGFFGLHPALSGLYNIYQQGHLAVLPATHYSNGNRSHFSSQDFIESGTNNMRLNDGWLNRHLSSLNQSGEIRAVSFDSQSHALQGQQAVAAINTISNLSKGLENLELEPLTKAYSQEIKPNLRSRLLVQKHGSLALNNLQLINDNLALLNSLNTKGYTPDNGAIYPDTHFGQQLQDTALLIKSGVGLEVVSISSNGWDHHANQGGAQGAQASRLQEFSGGIEAIYKDLGATYMNDVVILTMSEFGRTAKQNASKGTDHGNASNWFVIGHQVNGGIYGDWPGLSPEQLYQERYLNHTIEYTDIMGEILVKHLGNSSGLPTVLPGSQYQPIGFL